MAPTTLGVKIAFNMAARAGDARSLLTCLRLAQAQAREEGDGVVDAWMLEVALLVRLGLSLVGLVCDGMEMGVWTGIGIRCIYTHHMYPIYMYTQAVNKAEMAQSHRAPNPNDNDNEDDNDDAHLVTQQLKALVLELKEARREGGRGGG